MEQPTTLITGGTGFAGSHLVDALQELGQSKIHVTAYGDNTSHVHQILPREQIHHLDLTKSEPTTALLKKIQPDQIYHLASLSAVGSSFSQVEKIISANTKIQLNLLQAVKEAAPSARVLTISSAAVYKPQEEPLSETDVIGPLSPYGVSKVTQDCLAYYYYARHELNIIRVRPFNHIGERQAQGFVVPDFALQIAKIEQGKQDKIKVGDLSAVRDFTDVKDMVKAYQLLMEQGKTGGVYNVGSGQGIQIKELLEKLISLAKTDIEVETDQDLFRPIDNKKIICDNQKIRNLGWKPVTNIDQTLSRVLDYYRTQV